MCPIKAENFLWLELGKFRRSMRQVWPPIAGGTMESSKKKGRQPQAGTASKGMGLHSVP
jgi:hypothetical protein